MSGRDGADGEGGVDEGNGADGAGPGERVDPPPDVGWPVPLAGVTESVVATHGPNGLWNLAALGLRAPDPGSDGDEPGRDGTVTARTWGRTRTRTNFEREGEGVVQFTRDPELFVEAALGIEEREAPVHPSAAAWVWVDVERIGSGESGGTEWVDWRLTPTRRGVRDRSVPTIDRGFAAVVEATVAASRLDVPAYDEAELLDRLDFLAGVVDAAGSLRERAAFERIDDHVGWRTRR